jgi:protein O-mannosyl-transferase
VVSLSPHRKLLVLYLGIAAVALIASVSAINNGFTYDDIVIITQNPSVKDLHHPWDVFTRSYWPKPFSADLYRPLTTLALATEWKVGNGKPWPFHAVSILEYVLVALAFYALARKLLPTWGAWSAAALFAAHPVHVEATAIGVNQGELLTALLMLLAVSLYLTARNERDLSPRRQAALTGLYLAGCLTKEHGLMLPGLLAAAELTVVHDPRPWKERLRELRPFALALMLVGVVYLGVRRLVLPDLVGTFAAEAFRGATMGGRALTMLSVVQEWLRLMLWPAHLQTDYTPREIEAATGWGSDQWLGVVLLIAVAALAWWARRRQPVVTFGILWVAVAVFPVSNVLVPTGIVLAERSLFLASAGMMLVVGSAVGAVETAAVISRPTRLLVAAGVGALVLTGTAAAFRRQMVWHDQQTLFTHMVQEAPLSYKAHWGYGDLIFRDGDQARGEKEYRLAIYLFPYSWYLFTNLGDRYRGAGLCGPAIKEYHRSLLLQADAVATRSSLIACLLWLGQYQSAKRQIQIGIAVGKELENLEIFRAAADAAIAENAPPGSVRVKVKDSTATSMP